MSSKSVNKYQKIHSSIMNNDAFFGIAGLIGAGKTVLARRIAEYEDFNFIGEPQVDSDKLKKFYKDMKGYSFTFQITLLNARFVQNQQAIWSGKPTIQDRTIYEDRIFAKILKDMNMMSEDDFETYCETADNFSKFLRDNSLIIFLDITPKVAMERIKKRNREYEKGITMEYLERLHKGYMEWYEYIRKKVNVIRIDWNDFRNVDEVMKEVKNRLKGIGDPDIQKSIHN
jgi:deoxyadenosine kinase